MTRWLKARLPLFGSDIAVRPESIRDLVISETAFGGTVTKRTLQRAVITTTAFYVVAVAAGVTLRVLYPAEKALPYATYKDMVPLLLAVPAAWLGFCFQRRSSYLQQLRLLWPKIVEAIQLAIQYTHLSVADQKDYAAVLFKLSLAIDEVRPLFRNVRENSGRGGLYPFEPLKDVYREISALSYGGDFKLAHAQRARDRVMGLWRELRIVLLHEFDREDPTRFASPYLPER